MKTNNYIIYFGRELVGIVDHIYKAERMVYLLNALTMPVSHVKFARYEKEEASL